LYLKNITLRGFKSFGNRSSLDFEPGISVIVGPNGSGKSNVADGISWVLGEQSPKSLRGTSMGDVIFRSKKQEMGIAEVSLLFDNSDQMFDVAFRDVKITRRVYSQGGSDYFINSSPCRLMDIQELIADSGIGKGLHIIINQGQVNEIAMLKPVERKLVIDEVLGISKHKSRRKKSLLKLGRVKDDIGRLDDLMQEIKRTMDPLEIEAKRAREYASAANELKKEEISMFLAHLSGLNRSWDDLEAEHKKIKDDIRKTGDRIIEIEKEKRSLIDGISSKQAEYEKWRAKLESFESSINRLYNNLALIESKKNVFSTLFNMFDLETAAGRAAGEGTDQLAGEKQKEMLDLSFLGRMIRQMEVVQGQLRSYMEKVKKALKSSSDLRQLEDEGNIIWEEMGSILEELRAGSEARESGRLEEASAGMNKRLQEERKRNEAKAAKIAALREMCRENLESSEKLREMLERKKNISEYIKRRLYPEFERQKGLISGEQKKIDDYNSEVGELKIKENRLDNELYRIGLGREQVKEKVKAITTSIVDDYNMSIEYAQKNFRPSGDIQASEVAVRRLKNSIRKFGSVNPNAAIEFSKIKKRYDFLHLQRQDLVESGAQLEKLIQQINDRISKLFLEKFEEINNNFQKYFKSLFPSGEGELMLDKNEGGEPADEELGVDLKVDIGNNKLVPLSLLSGGEKSLVAMAFLFAVFSINMSPFYVFDEADAALDDANLVRFQSLVKDFSRKQQIIIITHQKKTMEIAQTLYGVTMQSDGISKVVSEKIEAGEGVKTGNR